MSLSSAAELPSPREPGAPYRVCLVCLGNICRSPMAETVLRAELAAAGLDGAVVVDSAGTGDWHVGDAMNSGAQAALARRGFDGSSHRARQIQPSWLARRDLVLAMDARNLADLRRMARGQEQGATGSGCSARWADWTGPPTARSPTLTAATRTSSATCSTCSAPPRGSSGPASAAARPPAVPRAAPGRAPRRPVTSFTSAARQVARQTGLPVREARVVGSQHGYQHLMLTLAGGSARSPRCRGRPGRPATAVPDEMAAAFAAEASSLRWLAEADAVPVPEVLAVTEAALVISMIPPGHATPSAAFRFGTELARLHAAGSEDFGAPWRGFIASLPLDNTPAPPGQPAPRRAAPAPWPQWYASRRLLPYLRRAVDSGALRPADGRLVEAVMDRIDSLAGPAEPPSRIHGDCWAGNVLWSGDRGWLIDPAAHGGHRETDLAMLALFGAPHLDRILAGYNDTAPLAAGWRSRVPLHQLHPLLVHACLFGASYAEEVRSAARAALSA